MLPLETKAEVDLDELEAMEKMLADPESPRETSGPRSAVLTIMVFQFLSAWLSKATKNYRFIG